MVKKKRCCAVLLHLALTFALLHCPLMLPNGSLSDNSGAQQNCSLSNGPLSEFVGANRSTSASDAASSKHCATAAGNWQPLT